jgi:hypothetical protein
MLGISIIPKEMAGFGLGEVGCFRRGGYVGRKVLYIGRLKINLWRVK